MVFGGAELRKKSIEGRRARLRGEGKTESETGEQGQLLGGSHPPRRGGWHVLGLQHPWGSA